MLRESPWDTRALGYPAYELLSADENALRQATQVKGLVTVRVDPLADKRLLAKYGFYYCDTLLVPFCSVQYLRDSQDRRAELRNDFDESVALQTAFEAFSHGRMLRDRNIEQNRAKNRFKNWLVDLLRKRCVSGLFWQGQQAGFIARTGNDLVLHAISAAFRGQGLAKFWWSAACQSAFSEGHAEVVSSISASNHAVLNLYASLGFRFRGAQDIYHRTNADGLGGNHAV